MSYYPDMPAFRLSCDSLDGQTLTFVIELPKYFMVVWAFRNRLDAQGNVDELIIFAPTQEIANDFAQDLGQDAKPVPATPPN